MNRIRRTSFLLGLFSLFLPISLLVNGAHANQSPTAGITMSAQGQTAYENQTLNLTVAQGQTVSVSFSGSRSSDPDGSIASYKWSINGTQVSLSSSFSFSLGAGTASIYLEVTDNLGAKGAVGATVVVITKSGPYTLTVQSSPDPGISITASPNDKNGQGSGNTNFTRTYDANISVNLTTIGSFNGKNFKQWNIDGTFMSPSLSVSVKMDIDHTLAAVYGAPPQPGLSSINGVVFDSSTGGRVLDVSVQIGGYSGKTNAVGEYSIQNVPQGNYTLTASKNGYYNHTEPVTMTQNTSLKRDMNLQPIVTLGEIKVLSVTDKYPGFVYYLSGTDFTVNFTANVDWGGHPQGNVRFITPKGSYDVSTTGTTASKTFNIFSDFEPCTTLKVVATSSDGATSKEKSADFTVMSPFLGLGFPLIGIDIGNGFYYKSEQGFDLTLIDEGIKDGVIPKDIPLFGEKGFNLRFVPTSEITVKSSGEVDISLDWENKPLVEGEMAGFEYSLEPKLEIEGAFLQPGCKYQWSGYAGFTGSVNLEKSWPFIFLAGPVPVPMFAKASLELTADAEIGVTDWPPQNNLNGKIMLEPYARGSLGAGVDHFLSVEGWIGGGADFGLQWPQKPTLDELTIYLNGGVTLTALLWKWEHEALRWDWELVKSAQGATALGQLPLDFRKRQVPKLIQRDYLNLPNYGTFSQRPKFETMTMVQDSKKYAVATATVQSTVYPYSQPSISSNGNNLYLAYLYDDPNRTSMNRTVAVFSSWDGTQWSTPGPIGDDGTADFSPQILAFSDGSAIAAWEDVKTQLPDTTTFEDMVASLEISVAIYNPVTKQWSSPLRLTSNGYLDRTPRLTGTSPNNVMVTWISNEANDIRGNASKPNKVWYSLWNGSQWTQPQVVVEVPYGIVKTSSAYDGQKAYITISIDTNNNPQTIEGHELFNISYGAGSWGGLVRLTSDNVPDDNPQLGIDPNGHFILVWLKGNDLVTAVDFDLNNKETITTNDYSSSFADFRMATGSNGRLAILWAEASENDSDIYMVFYDPIFKTWGKPKQLTFDQETERNLTAAFYEKDTLIATYNKVQMGLSQTSRTTSSGKMITSVIPVPGQTDLAMLKYVIGGDLVLQEGSLIIDPPNPVPGTMARLTVTAINLSDLAARNIDVAFYNGNPSSGGFEIGRSTIINTLNPGDGTNVSINWAVPNTVNPLDIYAVIDPDKKLEDRERTNNIVGEKFIKPDLSIQSVYWSQMADNLISITARVTNQGAITSPETEVTFREGSSNGTILSKAFVPKLGINNAIDINYLWDLSGNPSLYKKIYLSVDESKVIDDFDRLNNVASIGVSESSSLMINLQNPSDGEVFNSCSIVNTHQPTFNWSANEAFTKYTILFSTSSGDFSSPIARANIKGTQSSWIPMARVWKSIMTSSYNNGNIRDIYWKVVGIKSDKTTVESEVRSFSIGDPQAVSINSPLNGSSLPSGEPPTFDFNSNCNVKFTLEFSPNGDFADPTKIKGFNTTTNDPNVESAVARTLTSAQWNAVKKLIGTGTGYFRITARDGMNRKTISEVRSFIVQ
jgi:hypothetical protein